MSKAIDAMHRIVAAVKKWLGPQDTCTLCGTPNHGPHAMCEECWWDIQY